MSESTCAIVPTAGRREVLSECLEALLRQTSPPDTIVVIDNASEDGTGIMLREKFPGVQVLRLPENTGAAGGFYWGCKWAYERGYHWMWFLDDDVSPEPEALEALLAASRRLQDVGLLRSVVRDPHGLSSNVPQVELRLSASGCPQWDQHLRHGMVQIARSDLVSALVHRRAIAAVGYPMKELFFWGVGGEFTRRITHTLPAYLVGASVVLHRTTRTGRDTVLTDTRRDRLPFYFYAIRNKVWAARCSHNLRRLVRTLASIALLVLKATHARPYPLLRVRVVLAGLLRGLAFRPRLELPPSSASAEGGPTESDP